MAIAAPKPHLWTRAEYDQVIAAGGFDPEARLELIDGEIIDMPPQRSRHATAIQLAEQVFRAVFPPGYSVRTQLPLALDDISEPEPDLAVVRGKPRDYCNAHPTTALLILEVAESSLDFDRGRKLRLYARNGILDYWILDLTSEAIEVYRQPTGDRYTDTAILTRGQRLAPLAAPDAAIAVIDLLP